MEFVDVLKEFGKEWDKIDVNEIFDLAKNTEDSSERFFYGAIGNAILQLRQKQVIKNQKW